MKLRLLVSVRSVAEALVAAHGGADFIDLKEPDQGALGGLPLATIGAIVAALRAQQVALPVSATIGDLPMAAFDAIRARVDAVAACGVDYVKVGIERDPGAAAVLVWLAQCGHPVVPVFIADRGLDDELIERALHLQFPAIMVDTADKQVGSLFDVLSMPVLQHLVASARASGTMLGLAGALRVANAAALVALAPDFAGFRSAVCDGDRRGELDAQRLRALAAALREAMAAQAPIGRPSPMSSERMRASSVR
jgi:(5-formylfuran-3-yl)methyl phosphate synthase